MLARYLFFIVFYYNSVCLFYTISEGIPCIDAATSTTFTLRAHILSWSGDIPALSKVMCTTGHNSYKACRFCYIKGIYSEESRHVYFPLKPPTGMSGSQYDPKSLPERTHKDYAQDAAAVEHLSGISLRREAQERGKSNISCTVFKKQHFCSFTILLQV